MAKNTDMDNGAKRLNSALIFVIFIALVFVVVLIICWKSRSLFEVSGTPGLEQISRATELVFPTDTKLRNTIQYGWLDQSEIIAIVEFTKKDIYRFIASIPEPHKISRTDRYGLRDDLTLRGRRITWWNPNSVKKFIAVNRQINLPGHQEKRLMKLLIAEDGATYSTVYIYYKSTMTR